MTAKIRKRIAALFIIALILACLSVPVAAEEPEAAAESDTIELILWQLDIWDYTSAVQAYVDQSVENVKVSIHSLSFADYSQRLKLALASGDVPDLVLFPNWLLPEFSADIRKGSFQDLTKISPEAVEELKSALAGGVWSTVNPPYVKSVSFVPLNTMPFVWFYRTDLLKQAGLPTAPDALAAKLKNWNAVAEAGKAFKTKTKKALFGDPSVVFESQLSLNGNVFYDKDGAYVGDKNPQIKKAYDLVVKGLKEGWMARYDMGTPAYDKAMKAGTFASTFGWPGTETSIKTAMGASGSGKWNAALPPGGTADGGALSGTIPAGARYPELALDLLQWLVTPDMQDIAYKELGLLPANLKLLSDPKWLSKTDAYFGKQALNRVFAQAAKTAKPHSLYQEYSPVPDAYDTAVQQLIQNSKADPVKLWNNAVKTAKSSAKQP